VWYVAFANYVFIPRISLYPSPQPGDIDHFGCEASGSRCIELSLDPEDCLTRGVAFAQGVDRPIELSSSSLEADLWPQVIGGD
jgi:hypothetical protein